MGCKGSKVRILSHRPIFLAIIFVSLQASLPEGFFVCIFVGNCLKGNTMDLELKGKRAIVTGGSKGIGLAIARVLAQEGADVALLARDQAVLDASAAQLGRETGRKVVGVSADTRSDEQVKRALAQAVQMLGGSIDILVNAAAEPAGFAAPPKLAEIGADYYHAEMDTKVMGYIRMAKEVAAGMQAKRWGRIVNISGLAARQTGNAVGSMRNVSVAALTKNLADELGPHGINVNVVHPGLTRTERTAPLIAQRAASTGVSAEVVEKQMADGNSIQHLVDASEVAYVVAFLCSPKSIAINGDVIAAGGGVPRVIHY
jgi:NAD(P)-dependent dehydrogenase (short-subunit alcohol dehydrogenase family)